MSAVNTDDRKSRQMVTCVYCDKVSQRRHLKEHTKTVHKDKQQREKVDKGKRTLFFKAPPNSNVEPLAKKQRLEENDDSESDHNNSITE